MPTNALPSSPLSDVLLPEQHVRPATYQLLADQQTSPSPLLTQSEKIQHYAEQTIDKLRTERAASCASCKNWTIGCMTLGATGIVLMATLLHGVLLWLITIPSVLFLSGCIVFLDRPGEFSEGDEAQLRQLFQDLQDPNQTEYNLRWKCAALGVNYTDVGHSPGADPFKHPIMCERIKREAEQNLGKAAVQYGYERLREHIPEIQSMRNALATQISDPKVPLQPIIDKHTLNGLKALGLSSELAARYKNDRPLLDAYVSPSGKMTEAEFEALVAGIPQIQDHSVDRLRESIQDPKIPVSEIWKKHSMEKLNRLKLLPVLLERIKTEPELLDGATIKTNSGEKFLGALTDGELAALEQGFLGYKDLLIDDLKKRILDPNKDIGVIVKNHTLAGLIKLGLEKELIARYKKEAPQMHYGQIIDQVGLEFIRKKDILTVEERLQKWEQWKSDPVIRDEWLPKIKVLTVGTVLDNGFISVEEAQKWMAYFKQREISDPRKNKEKYWNDYFAEQENFYESVGLKMDPLVRINFRTKISGMTFAEFMNEYMPETENSWANTKLIQLLLSRPSPSCSPQITSKEFSQLIEWYNKLTKASADTKAVVAAEIDKEFQEQFVKAFMRKPDAPFLYQMEADVD